MVEQKSGVSLSARLPEQQAVLFATRKNKSPSSTCRVTRTVSPIGSASPRPRGSACKSPVPSSVRCLKSSTSPRPPPRSPTHEACTNAPLWRTIVVCYQSRRGPEKIAGTPSGFSPRVPHPPTTSRRASESASTTNSDIASSCTTPSSMSRPPATTSAAPPPRSLAFRPPHCRSILDTVATHQRARPPHCLPHRAL